MPSDIKGILDSIIDGANNKFPNDVNSTLHQNMNVKQPQTFDAGDFREKLSLYVLKDVVCAMMHDDTKDLDGMIDQSIMKHIHDDHGCTCYGYLCKSRDKLNSPIMSDIIQEIDEKTMTVQSKVIDRQDDGFTADAMDLKDELKNIENYDELRKRIKDTVSKKVVEDVAKAIANSTEAPTFTKNLDDKLQKKSDENAAAEAPLFPEDADETTNESTILKMCGRIVTESPTPMSTEEGLNCAIVEYCLAQMDYLFKQDLTFKLLREYD